MDLRRKFVLAVLLFAALPAAHAAGTSCPQLFEDGQAPDLVDSSLSERTTAICYTQYSMLASGVTKGPLWSAEHLTTQQMIDADNTSRTGSFHAETQIPAADRSELSDYSGSGFDRGHMTPAGDEGSAAAERETFSLANVVPQNHTLNTGIWERIETQVRTLAKNLGEIYVVTGPVFSGTPSTIGADDVVVPSSTWKAVYEPGVGAGVYVCTNVSSPKCSVESVNALIQQSGVDPFPTISDAEKSVAISLPLPN